MTVKFDDNGCTFADGTVVNATATGMAIPAGTGSGDAVRKDQLNGLTGHLGEMISVTQQTETNLPTSATYGDILTLTLTAGTWDLSGTIRVLNNALSATLSGIIGGVSTTSGNSFPDVVYGDGADIIATNGANIPFTQCTVKFSKRIVITSTTNYYVKLYGNYSVATPTYKAFCKAVRVAL